MQTKKENFNNRNNCLHFADYKLRIETMIVQTEFAGIEAEISTNLKFYRKAIQETMESTSLDEFLRLVLRLGNFINMVNMFEHNCCSASKNPYYKVNGKVKYIDGLIPLCKL